MSMSYFLNAFAARSSNAREAGGGVTWGQGAPPSSSLTPGPCSACGRLRIHAINSDNSHALRVPSGLRGVGKVPAFSIRQRVIRHKPVSALHSRSYTRRSNITAPGVSDNISDCCFVVIFKNPPLLSGDINIYIEDKAEVNTAMRIMQVVKVRSLNSGTCFRSSEISSINKLINNIRPMGSGGIKNSKIGAFISPRFWFPVSSIWATRQTSCL